MGGGLCHNTCDYCACHGPSGLRLGLLHWIGYLVLLYIWYASALCLSAPMLLGVSLVPLCDTIFGTCGILAQSGENHVNLAAATGTAHAWLNEHECVVMLWSQLSMNAESALKHPSFFDY
jgi:hypothetical protein